MEISTRAFEHNYRLLTSTLVDRGDEPGLPVELLAIVKADAYGHGLRLCAPAAVRAGARWLGVTSVEEGVAARSACSGETGSPGTDSPEILVISGVFPGQGAAVIEHRLTAVVWDAWQLDELEVAARAVGCDAGSVAVHLELDTGMNRQGVAAADLKEILARFDAESPLRMDGLMTHLYAADESDGVATHEQFERLEEAVRLVHAAAGRQPIWLHVGNSAAVLAGEVPLALQRLCSDFGMKPLMRPGLALYGLAPEFSPDEPERVGALRNQLQPVLAWKTRVASVREVSAGQAVGYNGTFVATEPMRLALLAVGYADGLKRALSNRGSVLVRGERAPIVGRISMDQTMVDVTGIAGIQPGDEVVLLGRQGGEWIAAEEHAALAGTISWEIFTSITERVERRFVLNG
ncbi:alanine racemase [Acidicapsa ligni]|uniref:alanine racemase n=1 Tax=Acidicapsa ligni TaxID=542300 RepID=UPI0021DFD232|nr:alanine racemase [Acidicapsa ligni]